MKKNELKEIILNILNYLKLKSNKDLTLQETIDYLQTCEDAFDDIHYKRNSLDKTLEQIKERYKELAQESLQSYEQTSNNFKKLADAQHEHIQSIENSDAQHIDLNVIKSKFSDIQEHMVSEVRRANEEINKLRTKIKLLEEESNIDILTKAFNRRALEQYLQKICSKEQFNSELHLLMLDIDDFKSINDNYGHIAGDKILIFIAHLLMQMLRDGDKVFRYGGEEFVIVLNRIDSEACKQIARRILEKISANSLIYKNDTIKVTVSIGATKYLQGDTPESLIARADAALYEAKENGKNKFVSKV